MSLTLGTSGSIVLDSGSNIIGQVEITDGTNVLGTSAHPVVVDGSAVTQPISGTVGISGSVAVTGTFWQATQPVSIAATVPTQILPATSGGMGLPFSASLTSTKSQVKGAAGQVYGWTAVNNGTVLCYIQVFNKLATNVTVGTTTPDFVIPVPAPASGTNGAGVAQSIDLGIAMNTGITIACTTTRMGSTSATCDVLFYFN